MAVTDEYMRAVSKATSLRRKPVMKPFLQGFNPDKETIILLPGGGGSNLWRADKKFDQVTNPANYNFDRVWLDPGIVVGDGRSIKISSNGRDLGERVIVADGDVQFINVKPYVYAMRFFRGQANFNAVLLGWDWRRDVKIAVKMVDSVIGEIKKTIKEKVPGNKQQDAMKKIFIVGHSMGGMVAKLFFQSNPDLAREIGGMISVGTPFYGYLGQLRRIFEGDADLNRFYGAKTVAVICSSHPGLYSLLPIDYDSYFKDGKDLKLPAYPVTEPDGQIPADAFQKSAPPFPPWVLLRELPKALELRQDLARELPDDLRGAVFHIRSEVANSTPVAAKWNQRLPNNYEPGRSPSPLKIDLGAGDDTIPYWSAQLASTPAKQITTFAEGTHMLLMTLDFVLLKIHEIVTRGARTLTRAAFTAEYGPNPQIASREELAALLNKIRWAAPYLERELDTLIPEKYAWRLLQDISM
jgi:pimeloyl-ACP methyl ester carboxylesterase